jgi:uncharacterized membrane protein YhaH (DUF805 family)
MRSVRDTLRLWFSFDVPVGPRDYVWHGLSLMLFKYLVDATVVWLTAHRLWSPLDYLNPSVVLREGNSPIPGMVRGALIVWTLPFVWIGASMSVRRAVDAGRSAWSGLLFFVPVVNYVIMIVLCTLPSMRREDERPAATAGVGASESPALDDRVRSGLLGMAASVAIGIPLTALCVLVLKNYGWAMFFGTPFLMGTMTGFIHNRRAQRPVMETLLVATLGMALVGGLLLLFAIEGAICVAMAFPFALVVVGMGALFGRNIARTSPGRLAPATMAVLVVPPLAALEMLWPAAPAPTYEVVSSVVIDAPPEVVWRHVVSFDELPPPREPLFRLGVAYPERAVIRGRGVGALRRCEFSTGAFLEPITVWDAPRRLSFDVTSQPEPMRELSPYRSLHPPHLARGFRAVRGEFRLVPVTERRTRLEGSTWYTLDIHPDLYWRLWADAFVGTIHERVLRHIRNEAEADRRPG